MILVPKKYASESFIINFGVYLGELSKREKDY